MKKKSIIDLCPDGKYRWVYKVNLFTNLIHLKRLWTVAMRVVVCAWIFVMIVLVGTYGFAVSGLLAVTVAILKGAAIALGAIALAYLIWAVSMKGRYCILYELDDRGIYCIRLAPQFTYERVCVYLDDYLSGTTGGEMLFKAEREASKVVNSDFRAVSGIRASERRNIIKLGGPFARNRIFTEGADFALVIGTISGNSSPQARRRIKLLEVDDYI